MAGELALIDELRLHQRLFDFGGSDVPRIADDGAYLRLAVFESEEHGRGSGNVRRVVTIVVNAFVVMPRFENDAVLDERVDAFIPEKVGVDGGEDLSARRLFPRQRLRVRHRFFPRIADRHVVRIAGVDFRLFQIDFQRIHRGYVSVIQRKSVFHEPYALAQHRSFERNRFRVEKSGRIARIVNDLGHFFGAALRGAFPASRVGRIRRRAFALFARARARACGTVRIRRIFGSRTAASRRERKRQRKAKRGQYLPFSFDF